MAIRHSTVATGGNRPGRVGEDAWNDDHIESVDEPTGVAATDTQAVIDAFDEVSSGGTVVFNSPGTYLINRTIRVRSKTRIIQSPGVKFYLDDSTNCACFANYGAQSIVDVASTTISGGVFTITEHGHTRAVGDSVYVENISGNSTLNGLKTITAVVAGVSWSYAASGSNPTNTTKTRAWVSYYFPLDGANFTRAANVVTVIEAGHERRAGDTVYITGLSGANTFNGPQIITAVTQGVSWTYANTGAGETATGTANLLGDYLIQLENITIDCNGSNQSNDITGCGMQFGNLSRSVIEVNASFTPAYRSMNLFNVSSLYVPRFNSYKGRVGIEIEGPWHNLYFGQIYGTGSDDVIAFGVTDAQGPNGHTASPSGKGNGDYTHVDSISGSSPTGLLKLYCFTGYSLGVVHVGRIGGVGQVTIGDATDADVSGGSVTALLIDEMTNVTEAGRVQLSVAGTILSSGTMKIGTFYDNWFSGVNYSISINYAISAIIIGSYIAPSATTGIGISVGAAVGTFEVQSGNVNVDNGGTWLQAGAGTTMTDVMLSNMKVTGTGIGKGRLVTNNSTGAITNLKLSNVHAKSMAEIFIGSSTSASAITIEATNCSADTIPGMFRNGGQDMTVLATNLTSVSSTQGFMRSETSGTVRFIGQNVKSDGAYALLSAGATVSINCPSFSLDVATATLSPAAGDMMFNSSATTVPGIGLVEYDGAAWRRVVAKPQTVTFSTTPALNCNLGNIVSLSTALTNNITWGAPSNIPPAGETITVLHTEDGTGGFNVAWNAAYIFPTAWSNTGNTANKTSEITFVSNGTSLIAQGANVWH